MIDELLAADIITETDDDLVLTESFRDDWRDQIDRLQTHDRRGYLASFFEADREALRIETNPDGSVTVRQDRDRLGEWPSTTAIDADVAAFLTLQDRLPEWEALTGSQRDALISRLRLFLEACPACDATLQYEESAVTPNDIPRVRCAACDTTIV